MQGYHPEKHSDATHNDPLRIALYSHDTCGLGHMRRNLLIAEALVEAFPQANVLLITGAREVAAFRFPPRVDAVSLPSLYKKANEVYSARSLGVAISELIRIRSNIIRTSIEAFKPNLFIVDKVARGTMGELDDTLNDLAGKGDVACVLGLRDILDEPKETNAEWENGNYSDTISKFYDAVWIYGDERVFDIQKAYNFSKEVAGKTVYAGYLDPSTRLRKARPDGRDAEMLRQLGGRFSLCAVGGGQDGSELAEAFARASFPEGMNGLILTGPHMPADAREKLQHIADKKPHLHVVKFLSEPLHAYRAATCIVSMGGYNTTLEILGLGVPALIVPRVQPRAEQLMRSTALAKLDLIDQLHPQHLSAEAISNWLTGRSVKQNARDVIDMQGLQRIPSLVQQVRYPDHHHPSSLSEVQHVFS